MRFGLLPAAATIVGASINRGMRSRLRLLHVDGTTTGHDSRLPHSCQEPT